MPNRFISDKICRSRDYREMTLFQRDLFIRLIVLADDFGRFDGRLSIIKGAAYPLESVTEKQIGDALSVLSTIGIVDLYVVNETPYLQFTKWDHYQQRRAQKSKYPDPIMENHVENVSCYQLISNDCKCSRIRIREEDSNDHCTTCPVGARAYELDRMLETYASLPNAEWAKIMKIARTMREVEIPLLRKAVLIAMDKRDPIAYLITLSEDWLVRGIKTLDDFKRGKSDYA